MRISDWSSDVCSSDLDLLFADCNATAPETALEIERIVTGSGASFVDAAIIGPPPKGALPSPRFYVSGAHAARFAALSERGLDIRVVRSEAHTSELQSLMRISYAVFCLKKKTKQHRK